jgi:hypothetical protein
MTDAQFDALHDVLCQIRDALVPQQEEPSGGCDHPDDKRVDMSTFSDPNHVVCGKCKQRVP